MKKFAFINKGLIFGLSSGLVMAFVLYLLGSFVNADIDFRNWDFEQRMALASLWLVGSSVFVVCGAMSDSMMEMERESAWDKRNKK